MLANWVRGYVRRVQVTLSNRSSQHRWDSAAGQQPSCGASVLSDVHVHGWTSVGAIPGAFVGGGHRLNAIDHV